MCVHIYLMTISAKAYTASGSAQYRLLGDKDGGTNNNEGCVYVNQRKLSNNEFH